MSENEDPVRPDVTGGTGEQSPAPVPSPEPVAVEGTSGSATPEPTTTTPATAASPPMTPAQPVAAEPAPAKAPVDPAPASPVPPAPSPKTSASAPTHSGDDEDDDEDEDDWDDGGGRDEQAVRWVSMVTTIGMGIIGVIGLQVFMSLVEGFSLKAGEQIRNNDYPAVTDDLLHRIGYAFGGLGATAQLFLVAGVVLITLPPVLGGRLTHGQYRNTGVALRIATLLAVVVAIGTLLWVRASLHEYTVKDVAIPRFVRIQYTNSLLGTLSASALAIFASITAHPLREWER